MDRDARSKIIIEINATASYTSTVYLGAISRGHVIGTRAIKIVMGCGKEKVELKEEYGAEIYGTEELSLATGDGKSNRLEIKSKELLRFFKSDHGEANECPVS